jgi:Arm DNA-binding domain/Phage integrase central domain
MGQTAKSLTKKRIEQLGPGRYRDVDAPGLGLYLQIGPKGTRSWLMRYQVGNAERMMGLGSATLYSLKQARKRAIEARRLLHDGVDPIEHKRATKDARVREVASSMTFRQACEKYLVAHAPCWNNVKHRSQWRTTLEQYAYPKLAERLVSGIDQAAINDALKDIWLRIPATSVRVEDRIKKVAQWIKDGQPIPKAARQVRPAKLEAIISDLRGGLSQREISETQKISPIVVRKVSRFLKLKRARQPAIVARHKRWKAAFDALRELGINV